MFYTLVGEDMRRRIWRQKKGLDDVKANISRVGLHKWKETVKNRKSGNKKSTKPDR